MPTTNARYQARAADGSLLFAADTAQRISDKVFDHMAGPSMVAVAYTIDTLPGSHFPIIVWAFEGRHIVGTQHRGLT